jgi:alkylhydroperoxidase family enzyme
MNNSPKSPRIPPLLPEHFTPEQKEVVGGWDVLNFSRVLARHPALYRVFVPFIEKVISFTDLPPWDREVLVIRALDQCGDVYEGTHHVDIAYKVGMTDAQIASIKAGGAELSEFDRTLIKAADELVHDYCISNATWQVLGQRYSTVELMEVVGLIGCYTTIAMVTRTFEMQLESKEESAEKLAVLRTYT